MFDCAEGRNGGQRGERACRLSQVTKEYLTNYYEILDNMIRGMTGAALCESISYNFIVQMIPHHRAAIQMSENLLRVTTNVPLQEIANGIITEQTKSIENMRCVQETCGNLRNSRQDLCLFQREMEQIMQTMFTRMRRARIGNSVNCNFMWEMIPHHQGAVEMSRNALRFEICPELTPILEAIITSQCRGIRRMRRLQACLRC